MTRGYLAGHLQRLSESSSLSISAYATGWPVSKHFDTKDIPALIQNATVLVNATAGEPVTAIMRSYADLPDYIAVSLFAVVAYNDSLYISLVDYVSYSCCFHRESSQASSLHSASTPRLSNEEIRELQREQVRLDYLQQSTCGVGAHHFLHRNVK